MRVNRLDDLEIVNPDKSEIYEDFYYFPDNRNLLVARDGRVINAKTGKLLKPHQHKNGHLQIVFSITTIKNEHKHYNIKHHRLIARTFIGRPSRHLGKKFSKLEVNHIDGVRDNNRIENLEWVIGKENIWHAHINGLHPRDKQALAKNIHTGEILTFHSVEHMAHVFGVMKPTMWKHLVSGNSGKCHRNGFIFKLNDDTPWIDYSRSIITKLGDNKKPIDFVITDIKNNKKIIMSGYRDTAEFINMSTGSFFRHMKKHKRFESKDFVIDSI